jgi:hypothetical protein
MKPTVYNPRRKQLSVKKRKNIFRPSLKATLKLVNPQQQTHQSQYPARWYDRAWQRFVIAATILGLLAVIDQFWGRPWPVDPEIHPQNTMGESSLILPFTVHNKSIWPMNNVAMTCDVDFVAWQDAAERWGGADSIAFYTGIVSIPGRGTINYPCDASSLIQIKDGTFSLRDTLSTKNMLIQPPTKVVKMCIWVGGDYRIGPKAISFTSILFKWPASQADKQWIEGPTMTDQDRPKPRPSNNFDDLECRGAVTGPYMYIKGYGNPVLLLNVLDRSKIVPSNS